MKLNDTQRTALWAGVAVLTVGLAALAYWIITSRRKYNGLVVIGNVASTPTASSNASTTTEMGTEAQQHFNDTSLPRGYRNNNPLNVRKNAANAWKGKVVPGSDPAFEQFITMAYGYRCALYLIRKFIRAGHNTLLKLITEKWAPWGDGNNNPTNYANFVANGVGISPNAKLDPNNREQLCKIAYWMAWKENGKAPATMDDIYAGWALL